MEGGWGQWFGSVMPANFIRPGQVRSGQGRSLLVLQVDAFARGIHRGQGYRVWRMTLLLAAIYRQSA